MQYHSSRALLGNLIDYAGTFPPAALSLENAMKEACAFRRTASHPWLLSKVVLTMEHLKKVSPRAWYESGSDGTPLPITVIGSAVEKPEDFARTLVFEMKECRRFNRKYTSSTLRQRVFGYETKLPTATPIEETSTLLADAFEAIGPHFYVDLFIEASLDTKRGLGLARIVEALVDWAEDHKDSPGQVGLKIRTGGNYFPPSQQVAEVIALCASNQVRLKATQGMHHAVSRTGDYGFVNFFGTLAFAYALGVEQFPPEKMVRCLEESDPKAFVFSDPFFQWRDCRLEVEQIEAARRVHSCTFGSCSVAEPDMFLSSELGV
jgi:hypothetical protein